MEALEEVCTLRRLLPVVLVVALVPVFTFHNTGLYNLAGPLSYPRDNLGLFAHTGKIGDVGKFRVPTLRNIALTAPYMHDGSIATLDAVLDHYTAGDRTPNPGK